MVHCNVADEWGKPNYLKKGIQVRVGNIIFESRVASPVVVPAIDIELDIEQNGVSDQPKVKILYSAWTTVFNSQLFVAMWCISCIVEERKFGKGCGDIVGIFSFVLTISAYPSLVAQILWFCC